MSNLATISHAVAWAALVVVVGTLAARGIAAWWDHHTTDDEADGDDLTRLDERWQ